MGEGHDEPPPPRFSGHQSAPPRPVTPRWRLVRFPEAPRVDDCSLLLCVGGFLCGSVGFEGVV